ncbi:hypothetical protein GCM10028806_33990 [Spirosoma terrae]|uniref:AAA family ATPase n=1 Tax=Spirosoma terrae TaxID=1968276 RepID=A0A6L9L8M6_9BACT|nr:AAA family ATPase [Spirosoma terrae]NDU95712.1 AAA family ATPase [Spirosoma terrae]
MDCLNLNHPDIQLWTAQVGLQETYNQLILHDGLLPDYQTWRNHLTRPALQLDEAKQMMAELIDPDQFRVGELSEIAAMVPPETSAAFWKNALYFGKAIRRDEVWEESFHAIFGSLIPADEKSEYLRVGKALLESRLSTWGMGSLENHYQTTRAVYPKTYEALSKEAGLNRLYEEELARLFVSRMAYGSYMDLADNNLQRKLTEQLKPYLGVGTARAVARLFTNLYRYLNKILGYYDKNREKAELLFDKIAQGQYAKARILTSSDYDTVPATRLIELGADGHTMSSTESQQLIWNIGLLALDTSAFPNLSEAGRIEAALSTWASYYQSSDTPKDKLIAEQLRPTMSRGFGASKTTVANAQYPLIVADVQAYLDRMKSYQELAAETDEDTDGGASEFDRFEQAANEVGPQGLSSWLKQYIATVGRPVLDGQGNPRIHRIQLPTGGFQDIPVRQAVDAGKIYYALARSLGNTRSDESRLRGLIQFSQLSGNEDTRAFVDRLVDDMAQGATLSRQQLIDAILAGQLSVHNPQADTDLNRILATPAKIKLNRVLKGFDLWVRQNMVMLFDPETLHGELFNANTNRVDLTQVSAWASAFHQQATPDPALVDQLADMDVAVSASGQVATRSRQLVQLLDKLGIRLSSDYVRYSVLAASKLPEAELSSADASLLAMTNLEKNQLLSRPFLKALADQLRQGGDPFSRTSDEKGGMVSRLRNLAKGNARFDESAMESNYKNAEGKTIYAHQAKTFHLQFFRYLVDADGLDYWNSLLEGYRTVLRQDPDGFTHYLSEDLGFYQQNWLLDKLARDPAYQAMRSKMIHFSADGLRQQSYKEDGKERMVRDYNQAASDGISFGSMSDREFDLYRLNSFFTQSENGAGLSLRPVYLGNLETSRTADFVLLPYLKNLYSRGQLSKQALTLFKQTIRPEYERIARVYRQLEAVEFDPSRLSEQYESYNTGKATDFKAVTLPALSETQPEQTLYLPKKGFRALEFSDSVRALAGSSRMTALGFRDQAPSAEQVTNNLVLAAMRGVPFEELTQLESWLQEGVQTALDAQWQILLENGVLGQDDLLLHRSFLEGDAETGMVTAGSVIRDPKTKEITGWSWDEAVLKENLYSKLLSDFLNTHALNGMVHGDPALTYKNDGGDMFKRFKGRNAAIGAFASQLTAPELGITRPLTHFRYIVTDEPVLKSDLTGDNIKFADAQNWTTVDGYRYALWGQARLSVPHARMLDKIQTGQPLSTEEIQQMYDNDVIFNSIKTVGADGQKYLKKSDTLLSRQMTSLPVVISADEFARRGGRLPTGFQTLYSIQPGSRSQDGDVSAWQDEAGNWQYRLWVEKPNKKELHQMRLRMEGWTQTDQGWTYGGPQAGIDLVMPVSASKMLTPNVVRAKDGQLDFGRASSHHVNLIDANFYGLQTDNPSGKTKIVDPTQMLEITLNELKGELVVHYQGKPIKALEVGKLWQQLQTARDKNAYELAWKTLVTGEVNGELEIRLDRFKEKAVQGLLASGGDKQLVEFFDPARQFNLNMPLSRDKFVAQFFSHFTKEVLSHKRAGDAPAHVSSYGHKLLKKLRYVTDASGQPVLDSQGRPHISWDVIREDDPDYYRLSMSGIQTTELSDKRFFHTYTDGKLNASWAGTESEQSGDWYITARQAIESGNPYIIDRLRHVKPRWEAGAVTGYFSEMLLPPWEARMTGREEALRDMVGIRIPSQDKHSAMNMEWVDALPHYLGSSIILPAEVVELSGGDFDVDKEYTLKTEGYWKAGQFVAYGTQPTDEGNYEDYRKYVFSHTKVLTSLRKKALLDTPLYQTLQQRVADFRFQLDQIKGASQAGYQEIQQIKESMTRLLDLDGELDRDDRQFLFALSADKRDAYQTLSILNDVRRQLLEPTRELSSLIRQQENIIMAEFGLPTNVTDWLEKGGNLLNNGWVNNQLLALQQQALVNTQTLGGLDGDAIYNTPASLDALNELKDSAYTDTEGRKHSLFGQTSQPIALHWFGAHSRVHRGNMTGKGLIGIGVNGNLTLIRAMDLGVVINPNFLPRLNGFKTQALARGGALFQPMTKDATDPSRMTRVFDLISTIITADTDEAKEQLNAFFGLTDSSQGVVIQLIATGQYSLKEALLFVNQPVIQRYLQASRLKDYAVLRDSESSLRIQSRQKLLSELLGDTPFQDHELTYTTDQLTGLLLANRAGTSVPATDYQQLGVNPLGNPGLEAQILFDYVNLETMNNHLSDLTRFVKLKKGFGSDMASFDNLVTSRANLGYNQDGSLREDYEEYKNSRAVWVADALEAPVNKQKAAQLHNYIRRILPGQQALQQQLFLRRTPAFVGFQQRLEGQLGYLSTTDRERVADDVESYLLTTLYSHWLSQQDSPAHPSTSFKASLVFQTGDEPTMARAWSDFYRTELEPGLVAEADTGIPFQHPLRGNLLFRKVISQFGSEADGVDTLKFDSIAKLRPEEQEGLMDAFVDLYQYKNTAEEGYVGPRLAHQLFYYFMMKDGGQFRMGSISKIFHTAMFSDLSQMLNRFMETGSLASITGKPNEVYEDQLLNRVKLHAGYIPLLQKTRLPRADSELAKKVEAYKMLTGYSMDGQPMNLRGKTRPSMLAFDMNPLIAAENENQKVPLINSLGLRGDVEGVAFPRTITYRDRVYELFRYYDTAGSQQKADAAGSELAKGYRAVYLQSVPLGVRAVSPVTTDPQPMEESRKLLRHWIQSPGGEPIRNYYRSVLGTDLVEVPTTPVPTVDAVLTDFVNHSGGAQGADEAWDLEGERLGIKSIHYREPGQGSVDSMTLRNKGRKATPLDEAIYARGKEVADTIDKFFGENVDRGYGHYRYRNYGQVYYSDAVFAISKGFGTRAGRTNVPLDRGTIYAIYGAILDKKPVYVFDQTAGNWNTWNPATRTWEPTVTPTLTKNFAGIGSRDLKESGRQAIRDVLTKTANTVGKPVEPKEVPVVEAPKMDEPKTTTVTYNYYGQKVDVLLDENNRAFDALLNQGAGETHTKFKARVQKVVDAYNENNGQNPQTAGQPETETASAKTPSGPVFTFTDGTVIETGFELGSQQGAALQAAVDAIKAGQTQFVLRGYAGTGKSTISKFIVQYFRQNKKSGFKPIMLGAPTHKARLILKLSMLRGGIRAESFTMAKILNKRKEDGQWVLGMNNKMPQNGILIMDESSMIARSDYDDLMMLARQKGSSIIFMGDPAQLPPVGQTTLSDALQFTGPQDGVELTEVKRISSENPQLGILTTIRQNLLNRAEKYPMYTQKASNGDGVYFTKNRNAFQQALERAFTSTSYQTDPLFAKVLSYTNSSVAAYNRLIRTVQGKTGEYAVGDILMGYNQSGENPEVQNGMDYQILESEYIQKEIRIPFLIDGQPAPKVSLSGYKVSLQPLFTPEDQALMRELGEDDLLKPSRVTILNPEDPDNIPLFRQLVAWKSFVDNRSVPWKFRQAASKDFDDFFSTYQMPQDLVSFRGQMTTMGMLRKQHPELFEKDATGMMPFEREPQKAVFEKNIDYGYAVTVHKSQGSTYSHTFVDYDNLENTQADRVIQSKGQPYLNEQNALKYVALSRNRQTVTALSQKAEMAPQPPLSDTDQQINDCSTPA